MRIKVLSLTGVVLLAVTAGPEAFGLQRSGGPSVVVIDGSSTVFRISRAAQEAYSRVPNVTVVVNVSGTGGGFRSYLAGKCDIVDASRTAKAAEEEKAKANPDLAWTRYVVGYDGITVVVNPRNTFVKTLSVAQLKAMWAPDSKVKTWNDVDPSWPNRPIVFYCPDTASGTFDYFTEAVVGKEKAQRTDVQASPDDNTLVNGVAGDPDGIGYFGYAYYTANSRKLRAIPVQKDDATPAVMPSPTTILDKTYTPLSRPLFIYVKNSAMRRPAVSGFVNYYLKYVEVLARNGGYVAPTAADLADNQRSLAALSGAPAAGPASGAPAGRAGGPPGRP